MACRCLQLWVSVKSGRFHSLAPGLLCWGRGCPEWLKAWCMSRSPSRILFAYWAKWSTQMNIKRWRTKWKYEKVGAKGMLTKGTAAVTSELHQNPTVWVKLFDSGNRSRSNYFGSVLRSQLLKKVYPATLFNTSLYFFFFSIALTTFQHTTQPTYSVQCLSSSPHQNESSRKSKELHCFSHWYLMSTQESAWHVVHTS